MPPSGLGGDWLIELGLTTHQPLWVILCCLPEKGRREIEETVEEMKERDRGERKNESEETEETSKFHGEFMSPALFLFEVLKMGKLTRGPLVLYHLLKYWSRKPVIKNNFRILKKPHAYLQTILKTPVKFQKDRTKTVGGVKGTKYLLKIQNHSPRTTHHRKPKTVSLRFSSKRRGTIKTYPLYSYLLQG